MDTNTHTQKKLVRRLHLRLAYLFLPLLGTFSVIIPGLARFLVNKLLSKIKGYTAQVDSVKITLSGSTFTLEKLQIDKNGQAAPFVAIETLQLIIDRSWLWQGSLNIELLIIGVDVNISKGAQKQAIESPKPVFDMEQIDIPVILTGITIKDASLGYVDPENTPALDIHVSNLQLIASNLSTKRVTGKILPADVMITADLLEGTLVANIKADLTTEDPAFDINAEVRNVNLVLLNNFLTQFGKFDVNRGTLNLFAEIAAKENKFTGYLKPEVLDLDIVGPEDAGKPLLNRIWQHVLGAAFFLFKNRIKDQLATKIPVSGTFKNPHTNIFAAVGELLNNAFGQAFKPKIDNEIDIHSVDKKVA